MAVAPSKRICFFKPEKENDPYRALFAESEYIVSFETVLDFEFVNKEKLRAALFSESCGPYDALILTSPRSCAAIRSLLSELSDIELSNLKEDWKSRCLFVVGSVTLGECPLIFDNVFNVDSDASQLAVVIKNHFRALKDDSSCWKLLFPCSEIRRDVLPTMLRDADSAHLQLDEIIVYSTKKMDIPLTCESTIWWAFFSPSGVEAVFACVSSNLELWRPKLRFAAIGKTTAESLARHGLQPHAVAAQPNANSMLFAIQNADLKEVEEVGL